MGLSFFTHVDIIFCLISIWYLRALSTSEYNGDHEQHAATAIKSPALLSPTTGWDLDSPWRSAIIPFITVSPALSPTENRESHTDSRIVSFAPRAVIVQDIDPPSTASSETFPSADGKPHGRRSSEQIKIDSFLAQEADDAKHTLKSRPLTPFVKFTGREEEEPLTAEGNAEFEVTSGSSVVIVNSVEGSRTLDVKEQDSNVTVAKEEETFAQPLLFAKA